MCVVCDILLPGNVKETNKQKKTSLSGHVDICFQHGGSFHVVNPPFVSFPCHINFGIYWHNIPNETLGFKMRGLLRNLVNYCNKIYVFIHSFILYNMLYKSLS